METAYAGVKLWAAAVEDADSTAPRAIRRALKNMRGHAPGGPVRIDPGTQHAFKRPRIGRVAADGQFEIVWRTDGVVKGDAWSNFIPESAKLTADWTYPWVCGNCKKPKY